MNVKQFGTVSLSRVEQSLQRLQSYKLLKFQQRHSINENQMRVPGKVEDTIKVAHRKKRMKCTFTKRTASFMCDLEQ